MDEEAEHVAGPRAPRGPTATVLVDPLLTVVASNPLAGAVLPAFRTGANLARFTFLTDEVHPDLPDWPRKTAQVAAMLAASGGLLAEDARFVALVGELASLSPDFVRAWARSPAPLASDVYEFRHPEAGPLRLRYTLGGVGSGRSRATWSGADARSILALGGLVAPG